MQRNRDVFKARERRQQIEELEDESDLVAPHSRQAVIGEPAETRAVDRDFTAAGLVEAANKVQQRRFAGTRRSDDPDHLSPADLEIDFFKRDDPPLAIIFFGDVRQLNQPGTLFIIATPIGNLEDITYRAVRVLGEADLIACEDTRQTRKLLDRYGIKSRSSAITSTTKVSGRTTWFGNSRAAKTSRWFRRRDAADRRPGYRLVQKARAKGIAVSPIPGPAAIIAALSASGLPTDAFEFRGFLAPKQAQRRKLLEALKSSESTLVFYEAPHRIVETLEEIAEALGERPVVVARELTKIHEEFLVGTAIEIRDMLQAVLLLRVSLRS